MNGEVHLREVAESDLPVFFEHQRDPTATRMAAFPAREREPFMAHWAKILANPGIYKQTIVYDGQVAGNVVSFEQEDQREVGYWLGREFWGKGIATRALSAFLKQVTERPLYGYVARHNLGSQRVLEKCGFRLWGESVENDDPDGEPVVDLIYILTTDHLH